MVVTGGQLNRFERTLFWIALAVGGVLIVVRLAAVAILTFLHHTR